MKRNLYKIATLAVAIFASSAAFGQVQPPNANLDDWTPMGAYEDPTGWTTSNIFSAFGGRVSVSKSTDKQSGTYAAKIQSTSLFGTEFFGFAGTEWPATKNQTKLTGWYKLVGDTSFAAWQYQREDTIAGPDDPFVTVSGGTLLLPTATWMPFEIYTIGVQTETPDTSTLVFMYGISNLDDTSEVKTFDTTGYLLIDDVQIDENASIRGSAPAPIYELGTYPNPALNTMTIRVRAPKAGAFTATIMNMNGQRMNVSTTAMLQSGLQGFPIDVSTLKSGVYILQVAGANGTEQVKFVKQ